MRAGHLLHWIVRARHLSTLFAITANHIPVNPTLGSNTDNDHWLNYVFFSRDILVFFCNYTNKKSIHHHNVNIKYELSYFGFMLHKSGNNLEIIEQLIRLRLATLVWLMVARLKPEMRISGISISHLMVKRRHAATKEIENKRDGILQAVIQFIYYAFADSSIINCFHLSLCSHCEGGFLSAPKNCVY